MPNIKGKVMSVDDKGYRLGTRHGPLQHYYPRTSFTVLQENFLSPADVHPSSTPLNLKPKLLKLSGKDKLDEFFASAKKAALQIDVDVYSIIFSVIQNVTVLNLA